MTDPASTDRVPDAPALRRLERAVRRRLDARLAVQRVLDSLPAIAQIVLAASMSYAIAHWLLGHSTPVLAVTVTITSLGLTRDARPRRVVETLLGITVGVAVADGLSLVAGKGLWQLALVLLLVLVVGRAASTNPAFPVAAAVPASLVLLLPDPEGGPFTRSLDGLVGGVVALVVTALIPRDPGRVAARDRRTLFSVFDEALGSVLDGLRDADTAAGELALGRLRRTQPLVDAWGASLDTALSVARISPFLRARLPELRRDAAAHAAADLASRHLRTLARRVEFLVRDGVPRPALAEVVTQIRTGIRLLGDERDDPQLAGAARSLLADLARRLDPELLLPGAPVPDAAVLLLLRPLVVDLLVGTGMPVDEARALLPTL